MEQGIWVIRFVYLDRVFYHFVNGDYDFAFDEAEHLKESHDFDSFSISRG
jgi:hypothetical protein